MTQDVQPLTWQKRTNLEEHQQFFSKINEIIDNLAPTVDEAEAAIAQATAAIASANDAIATANAASAAASAAASQAQTAASTVAGYDSRLTTDEGNIAANAAGITALQGRMGTAEGNITALQNVQGDYVKKAGASQTVTSQIMVPTTATGLRDTQIANGTRIQNDLDNYAAMIRTTGSQTKAGPLELTDVLTRSAVSVGRTAFNIIGTSGNCFVFNIRDSNNKLRGSMNHQSIMSGDRATRNILTLQSDDYSTDDQTGAVGSLALELIPSGRLQIRASVSTGDGRTASQTIATLTAV